MNIGSMLRDGIESKLSTHKSCPKLCHQFFCRIGIVTEALAELTIAARFMPRPVHQFMQGSGIVATSIGEAFIGRQSDAICLVLVVSSATSMGNACACCLYESLTSIIAFLLVNDCWLLL